MDEPQSSVQRSIEDLCHVVRSSSLEELTRHAKGGNITLDELKMLAIHFKLKKTQKKEELVNALKLRMTNEDSMDDILGDTFRKTRNTLPRIINFLMRNEDALLRSQLLAERMQLDAREMGSRLPLYADCVASFNDAT